MVSLVDRREVEKLLVIHAALVSGLVDGLGGAPDLSPAEAGALIGGDERACRVLLHALAEVGVAEIVRGADVPSAGESPGPEGEEERFRLTPLGRSHLLVEGPDLERHSLLHQVTKLRGWLELPYVLEHGHPPEARAGRDIPTFGRTMAEGEPRVMDAVVDMCLAYAAPYEVRRVLDAGGALGHIALRFARRGAEAVLCDRPEMLQEAEGFLAGQTERDRIRLSPCDFNVALPPGPFDIAYLGNVYHIYGPEKNAALSRRVFEVLAPGGVIAVRDFVWERSPRAAMFAVNMLQATEEGGVWREADYRAWLSGAGFEHVRIQDVEQTGNQLILGRRPIQ